MFLASLIVHAYTQIFLLFVGRSLNRIERKRGEFLCVLSIALLFIFSFHHYLPKRFTRFWYWNFTYYNSINRVSTVIRSWSCCIRNCWRKEKIKGSTDRDVFPPPSFTKKRYNILHLSLQLRYFNILLIYVTYKYNRSFKHLGLSRV